MYDVTFDLILLALVLINMGFTIYSIWFSKEKPAED